MKVCWSQDCYNEHPMFVRLFENTWLISTILYLKGIKRIMSKAYFQKTAVT